MSMSIAEIEEMLLADCGDTSNLNSIGWISTYVPEEIIIAAGFQPYRIMGTTSPIGMANTYLIGNLCSFVQSCLEAALMGEKENRIAYR